MRCRGLRLQQFVTRAVHSDALEMCIDRGEEADDLYVRALTEYMQTPRTIFSAAPGEKNL
jgi:hypothetical protein